MLLTKKLYQFIKRDRPFTIWSFCDYRFLYIHLQSSSRRPLLQSYFVSIRERGKSESCLEVLHTKLSNTFRLPKYSRQKKHFNFLIAICQTIRKLPKFVPRSRFKNSQSQVLEKFSEHFLLSFSIIMSCQKYWKMYP